MLAKWSSIGQCPLPVPVPVSVRFQFLWHNTNSACSHGTNFVQLTNLLMLIPVQLWITACPSPSHNLARSDSLHIFIYMVNILCNSMGCKHIACHMPFLHFKCWMLNLCPWLIRWLSAYPSVCVLFHFIDQFVDNGRNSLPGYAAGLAAGCVLVALSWLLFCLYTRI